MKQGGILSPVLFCVYIDGLLNRLAETKTGYVDRNFLGCLEYADDVILLAPTAHAVRLIVIVFMGVNSWIHVVLLSFILASLCVSWRRGLKNVRKLPFNAHRSVLFGLYVKQSIGVILKVRSVEFLFKCIK